MAIVVGYVIEDVIPDFDQPEFKDDIESIRKLIPNLGAKIQFDLIGVSDKIANAIRRVLIDELEVVALDFDTSSVDTNDEYIIADELRDRIRMIPIDQTTSIDTVYSLSLTNTTTTGVRTIYSEDIAPVLPKSFHIAEVKPGGYLSIPKISVIKGFGFEHAMFGLTSDIVFINIDYMDVHYINQRGNILTRRVLVDDLALHTGVEKRILVSKSILVIPATHDKFISDRDRNRIKNINYDYTILNVDILERSSSTDSSKEFMFNIYLTPNIKPGIVIPMVCETIQKRLIAIRNSLKQIQNTGSDPTGLVLVKLDNKIWSMQIIGETHTIGEMLVKHIGMLDPSIANVKKRMAHPRDKNVFIELWHPNPLTLVMDTINVCWNIFETIRKETSI